VKEKSDGGLASTFPAVHAPASSLVPYAFPIHVNRIGRRIWSLVAACTAIWSGRENAAYSALVRTLLKQAPVRIQDVGLEGHWLRHSRRRRTLASSQLCCRHIQLRLAAGLPRSNIVILLIFEPQETSKLTRTATTGWRSKGETCRTRRVPQRGIQAVPGPRPHILSLRSR
jgi:hypothetical protein